MLLLFLTSENSGFTVQYAEVMSDKQDRFQPRRTASVDGFFAGPGQQPRQPAFRTPQPTAKPQSAPRLASAPTQPRSVGLQDMHRKTSDEMLRSAQRPVAESEQDSMTDARRRQVTVDGSVDPKLSLDGGKKKSRRQLRKERKRAKKAGKKQSKVKRIFKWLGIILLIAIVGFGAMFWDDIRKLTGNNNPLSLLGVFTPSELKNTNGRVNILVAGNSADDLGHGGAELTDSIMVLSINTKDNTAMMLSIPRDLYVDIPGYGWGKINAAYPNGGMDNLQTVVEEVTGLTVHYQALVNYTAFRDLVDAVGGITITIDSTDERGLYDPSLDWTTSTCCALVDYPNGEVTLDGKQALNLARARGDSYGSYGYPDADYTRTKYQRIMLMAIKDKASSTSVIANPFRITRLIDAVGNNVRTNLQVSEMQTLYYYGKEIDNSRIDSYNIRDLGGEGTYMLLGDMINGQSVQVPAAGVGNYTEIQEQIDFLFNATPVEKEAASVVVLNATNIAGLAAQESDILYDDGLTILGKYDAPDEQAKTTIVDNSNGEKPNTLSYLKSIYGATVIADETLTANYPSADFIILIGQDIATKAAQTNGG